MALSDITLGNFTKFYYWDKDLGVPAYVAVDEVQTLTHPTAERNIIEVNEFCRDISEKRVGSTTVGNAEIVVNLHPSNTTHARLLAMYKDRTITRFKIEVNDGPDSATPLNSYFEFDGQLSSKTSAGEFDSVMTATFSITVTNLGEWDVDITDPIP
jgi:hypothetical protein